MILASAQSSIGIWQLVLVIIFLLAFLMPIVALISILGNKFKDNDKLIWVLVVLLLPFVGALLYFFIGYPKRLNRID